MNGNPNSRQKDWHNWLRDHGCFICYSYPSIHHIKGSKMKLKGFVKPGEDYVIPLCYEHHQGSSGIHTSKKLFVDNFGTEKEMFRTLVDQHEEDNGEMPMDELTFNAIVERA